MRKATIVIVLVQLIADVDEKVAGANTAVIKNAPRHDLLMYEGYVEVKEHARQGEPGANDAWAATNGVVSQILGHNGAVGTRRQVKRQHEGMIGQTTIVHKLTRAAVDSEEQAEFGDSKFTADHVDDPAAIIALHHFSYFIK